MSTDRSYVTERGLVKLQAELARLKNEDRLELIDRLADVTSGGDWMDNAERSLIEEDLRFVESRIRELEGILSTAEIIPPDRDPDRVNLGDTVVLETEDGETESYTIVGASETDPDAGLISHESPLGKALLNHRIGDVVVVHAPAGDLHMRVVALK